MERFPIKYLEENLVFHHNGTVWAYYEWLPYNYSCISEDKAAQEFRKIYEIFSRCGVLKVHLLMLNTRQSIHKTIEKSKSYVTGELKETAYAYLDKTEEYLKRCLGESELNVRYFIGFQLSGGIYDIEKEKLTASIRKGLGDF